MRVLFGAVAGAVVVFIVSAILHMATPLGTVGIGKLPNETATKLAVRATVPRAGLYMWNGGFLITHRESEEMTPRQLGLELLANFFAAFIAAWLLSRFPGPLVLRACAVAFLAVFAFFSTAASHWIWYHFPTDFVLGELITELACWFAAGLVMAKIVRPPVRFR
jgi:hypothetical protein